MICLKQDGIKAVRSLEGENNIALSLETACFGTSDNKGSGEKLSELAWIEKDLKVFRL